MSIYVEERGVADFIAKKGCIIPLSLTNAFILPRFFTHLYSLTPPPHRPFTRILSFPLLPPPPPKQLV